MEQNDLSPDLRKVDVKVPDPKYQFHQGSPQDHEAAAPTQAQHQPLAGSPNLIDEKTLTDVYQKYTEMLSENKNVRLESILREELISGTINDEQESRLIERAIKEKLRETRLKNDQDIVRTSEAPPDLSVMGHKATSKEGADVQDAILSDKLNEFYDKIDRLRDVYVEKELTKGSPGKR